MWPFAVGQLIAHHRRGQRWSSVSSWLEVIDRGVSPQHLHQLSCEVSMKNGFFGIIVGCALALLACVTVTHSQTVTGTITGEVTDPSGAVIAGARVLAHN